MSDDNEDPKKTKREGPLNRRNAIIVACIPVLGTALLAGVSKCDPVGNGEIVDPPSVTSGPPLSNPAPTSTVQSKAPSSVPTSATPAGSSTSSSTGPRKHYQGSFKGFRVDGDLVWRYDGNVASSGSVDLGESGDTAKCRVTLEFNPVDSNGKSVDTPELRGCRRQDGTIAQQWPEFGPVEFDNDPDIDSVIVTMFLDGDEFAKVICPRLKSCVQS